MGRRRDRVAVSNTPARCHVAVLTGREDIVEEVFVLYFVIFYYH